MSCSIDNWISVSKSSIACKIHNTIFPISERCPKRTVPIIADGKVNLSIENSKRFDKQFMSNHEQSMSSSNSVSKRSYVRKVRDSVYERFHNHGVKFQAVVDWDAINVVPFFINRYSCYKRLDFDDAIVKVYRRSILITLRSSREVVGHLVCDAELMSIMMIKKVLDSLPRSIKVSNPEVVNVHNAFVNHAAASRDVKVIIDGEDRLISDNSKGMSEFEAVNPKHAVEDSVLLEEDGTETEMLNRDYTELVETGLTRKFIAQSFNKLIKDRQYYAEHIRSHVSAIQSLDKGISKFTESVDKIRVSKDSSKGRSELESVPITISRDDSEEVRGSKMRSERQRKARLLLDSQGWPTSNWGTE